jgi:hypothetical protein
MDGGSLLSPRGPLAPGVYWRRRLALFAAIMLFVLVGVYSCSGDEAKSTAGSKPAASTPTSAQSPAATKTKAAAAKPTSTPTRTATPKPTPSANPGAPCPDSAVQVAATADRKRYGAGVRPVLTLSLTNTGKVACTRDVGQQARELRLTSGNDRVWSSDDCSPGGTADRVVLKPGERRTFTVTWARRRSKPGCPGGQAVAAPGTYRLLARLGEIEARGTAFLLS